MATLADTALSVLQASRDIDQAIIDKGGTTLSGLSNAAAAIAAIPSGGEPEYPHPWKDDGNTHIWWYFGPNSYPHAYFNAQYVSDGHTFTVNWGDGTTETIAASSSFTTRSLTHDYAQSGEYEVIISGYDKISINQDTLFGGPNSAESGSSACVRQLELAGDVTGWNAAYAGPGLVVWKAPTNAITSIRSSAFFGCVSLVSVSDLQACTSIGSQAFVGCISLTSIGDMPSLTTLEVYALTNCTALVSIGDMSGLTNIGSFAFNNCPSIASLTFNTKTHTEVEAITGFTNLPDRGTSCVFHCSDGNFYRSGSSLLPLQ